MEYKDQQCLGLLVVELKRHREKRGGKGQRSRTSQVDSGSHVLRRITTLFSHITHDISQSKELHKWILEQAAGKWLQ